MRGYTLKPLQKMAIEASKTRDVVVVVPTGYGKTLIIEEAPDAGSIALVCSPLNVIIEEQKKRYAK